MCERVLTSIFLCISCYLDLHFPFFCACLHNVVLRFQFPSVLLSARTDFILIVMILFSLLEVIISFCHLCFRNGFHIIHICTEMSPVVSVGSLAPYITGLSCALQRKGNLVEVILPK